MLMRPYDFPVALQPLYTKEGIVAPRVQAVVRTDTQEPIAAVGKHYKLVPHKDVVEQAEAFIAALGKPERDFGISHNGGVMHGILTYREITDKVSVKDVVGLRVYIWNSYNTTRAIQVKIGALVLSCLNGNVYSKNIYSYTWRHTTSTVIEFPKPEGVLATFADETKRWRGYAEQRLAEIPEDGVKLLLSDIEQIFGAKGYCNIQDRTGGEEGYKKATVWDLMQACTYEATHVSKLSTVGRLNRLERVSRVFDNALVN